MTERDPNELKRANRTLLVKLGVVAAIMPMTGQAVPSYGPRVAGEYFKKLDCFCFSKQGFEPHETRRMPVVFVIDPKLPKDVNTITLSYTFFEVEGNRS